MLVFIASLISVHFSFKFTYERRYRGLHRPDCSLCWIFLGRSPRFLWHFVKHLASRMDLIRLKSRASLTFPHMVVHLYAYLAHIGLPTVLLSFGFLPCPAECASWFSYCTVSRSDFQTHIFHDAISSLPAPCGMFSYIVSPSIT